MKSFAFDFLYCRTLKHNVIIKFLFSLPEKSEDIKKNRKNELHSGTVSYSSTTILIYSNIYINTVYLRVSEKTLISNLIQLFRPPIV